MGKVKKLQSKTRSQICRLNPFSKSSLILHKMKGCKKPSTKKYWEEATCSVCMEFPHNAVLLLCSSHDKGCRPFMCATSFRYSNCLEQYKRAYTKATSSQNTSVSQGLLDDSNITSPLGCSDGKTEISELLCPLCRGQVKGWTVVEPARKYLNAKKRTCMQENCSFVGCYKELRKHVRAEHPRARPREVDPMLAEKWRKLENERELDDVFSTIRSTMPGAIVMGDYVIEGNYASLSRDYDMDDYLDDALLGLDTYSQGWNGRVQSRSLFESDYDSLDEEDFGFYRAGIGGAPGHIDNYLPRISGYHSRSSLGRSRRRRRHRTGNSNRGRLH